MSEASAIRAARREDVPALLDLYNHYVRTSAVTFDIDPLSPEARLDWFDHHGTGGPHRLLVADAGGRVVGYATSSRLRPKPAYDTSVETSVYVTPDLVGHGIGRALYAALFTALDGHGLHRAYAGIALPNDASVALHVRFGFVQVGLFREVGRKFGRWWDVAWFEKPLPG